MKHDHDIVDSALNTLRSGSWTGSFNPQLEEKLMQEFDRNRSSSRVARHPVWAAAIAILVLGGGAFAAGGGIDMIKSLFVTVEVAGEQLHVELQPVGDNTYEGSLETQTADGRQANIHVRRQEQGDDRKEMYVNVNVSDDGSEQQEVSEVKMQRMMPGDLGPAADQTYTVEDLGDAEPVHTWTSTAGDARGIYLIPEEAEARVRIFSVTTPAEGDATVRMLTRLPAGDEWLATPTVSVDDKDVITLTWESGDGEEKQRRVIKLVDRVSKDPADLQHGINLEVPGTEFKIKVSDEAPAQQPQ